MLLTDEMVLKCQGTDRQTANLQWAGGEIPQNKEKCNRMFEGAFGAP